jgi:hypothetical protein
LLDVSGTCDVLIYDKTNESIHVIDWKFGKGVFVDVENNDQLTAYAAGAAHDFHFLKQWDIIHIHVVQPRKDNFGHIALTNDQLALWISARLIPGVKLALQPQPPFNPGIKQCRWCPAKATCRHRYQAANKAAADVFQAVAKLPDQITPEEVAEAIKASAVYEKYLHDLRAYAMQELLRGGNIPGYKLVEGRSIRRWKDPEETANKLVDHGMPFEDVFESKLVSPAKAEKLNRKIRKAEWFQELIEKPPGKPQMAPETDKRPEYQPFRRCITKP